MTTGTFDRARALERLREEYFDVLVIGGGITGVGVALDAASRGYLLHLEQVGILKPQQRELVIDRLLALDNEEIDVEQTKWVVMMVLFSQPGQREAFAKMEDLVYADDSAWVH
mgnify:CR=1 FL=1